jgi:plasmid stability protein
MAQAAEHEHEFTCYTFFRVPTGKARMTNLTIAIDDKLIRQARVRAINEGTSVSARIREFLTVYAAGENRQQQAAQNFIALARRSKASSQGVAWNRADLYDRPYPSAHADK